MNLSPFPYTTLTDWLLVTEKEWCLLRGTDWMFSYDAGPFLPLKCQCMCRCVIDCHLAFFVSETTRWMSTKFGMSLYSKKLLVTIYRLFVYIKVGRGDMDWIEQARDRDR